MRILHTSDWHLGKYLDGRSRLDEQRQFLDDFIIIAEEQKIDLIIIAGDIYDHSNPPAIAEKMFYDTLKKLSKNGERIILVIAGNHDNPERLAAAGPLAMEHGIIMAGLPKTVVQPGDYGQHKVLRSGEGYLELEINNEKAVVLLVPYPSEKRLNEVLYQDMANDEERLTSYSDRIHALFEQLEKQFREDTINLVVSHLFAMNSKESGSERGIQLGGSYLVNGSCFPKAAQYIALGHIHKAQVVPGTDKRAFYSGAPLPYHKDEINQTKKCFIIDIEAHTPFTMEEIILKEYKPIVKWKCTSVEDAISLCETNKEITSWVYLEIETNTYIKDEEMKQMREFIPDIIEIYPIMKQDMENKEDIVFQGEKNFMETFQDFYKSQNGIDAEEECIKLLLSVIEEGDDQDETTEA